MGSGRVELLRDLIGSVDLRAHTLLLVLGGSRAYGIAGPDSDVDLKGVAIPPAAHFHGLGATFEQADRPDEMAAFTRDLLPAEREAAARTKLEGTVYEIRKLLRLALDANPNVLDVLFCRDSEVRLIRDAGRELRRHRALFLSQRCAETFTSYARAQLQRIRAHPVEPADGGGPRVARRPRRGRARRHPQRRVALRPADRGGRDQQEAIRAVGPRAAVPPAPDLEAADRLCVRLVEDFLRSG